MIFIMKCFAIVIEAEFTILLFLKICIIYDEVRKRQHKAEKQEEKKEEKIREEKNLDKIEKHNTGKNDEDNGSEEKEVVSTVDAIREEESTAESNPVAKEGESRIKDKKIGDEDVSQLIEDNGQGQDKRLGIINGEKMKEYGFQLVMDQRDTGELRVVREEGSNSYVIPWELTLSESSYNYTSLSGCFEVRQTIQPGKKYRIEVVKEACLKKSENIYTVALKGELRLSEIM